MLLLLLSCAPEQSACERFIAAKAACYEAAGETDDTTADACGEDTESSATADELYTCYAEAYESGDCSDADGVAAAGAVAADCV